MARQRKVVKLGENDWDSLFPGKEYRIGETSFHIYPLSLASLALIAKKISSVTDKLSNMRITAETFMEDSSNEETSATIVQLVQVILDEVPSVLAEMSGLAEDDVRGLPLAEAVRLFSTCLDVNITSQESLVKNLKELGDKFKMFTQGTENPMRMPTTNRTPPAH